jgi:hypothetical protein
MPSAKSKASPCPTWPTDGGFDSSIARSHPARRFVAVRRCEQYGIHKWKKRPGKPDRFCVCRKFSDASRSRSYFFAFFFEAFFAFFAFFAAFFLATVILLTEPTV